MLDILLCILTTTMLIVVFRLLGTFNISTYPTIVVNYWVCVATGVLSQGHLPPVAVITQKPWFPISLVLGFLFITVFNLIGASTRQAGVTVTAIANKMSLAVPISAAFLLYGDQVTTLKIAAILVALASILLTTYSPASKSTGNTNTNIKYLLPIGVFIGSGIVDTLVNYVQNQYLRGVSYEEFLIFLFLTAAVLGLAGLIVQLLTGKVSFTWKTLVAGMALGLPNYGSIYFLMRALEFSGLESSAVWPTINIGVVTLSAIMGYFAFKEQLSRLNLLGIILAITAIFMLYFTR